MKLRRVFYLLMIMGLSVSAYGQDPEFSQFYAAPLHLNPATAGMAYGPRITLNYRNEWPSIDNGYQTYAIGYDQHIDALSGGIGVQLMADRVAGGLLNSYSAQVMYAYQLKLSRNFGVKAGVSGGVLHRNIDWASLTFNDQINPVYGFSDAFGNPNITNELAPDDFNRTVFDMAVGAIVFSKNFYGGVAVKHLTSPNDGFRDEDGAGLPLRFTVHAGGEFDLFHRKRNKELLLSPNVLFTQQSNFTQLNLGTHITFDWLYGGVWYRHTFNNTDAVIGLIGVKIAQYVKVGYSYDVTLSNLRPASGGTHELSLVYMIMGEDNSLSPKRKAGQLECPSIMRF